MAVAAYASLVSLINVLDNLHYRAPFHLPHTDRKQIERLQQKVHSLSTFSQYMEKVISEMDDCIKKDLLSVIKEEGEDVNRAGKQPPALAHTVCSSSASSSGKNNIVVGINEHVVTIMEKMVGDQGVLQMCKTKSVP